METANGGLDAQWRKTGRWTEPDEHGGVMVGDDVDGERGWDRGKRVGEWATFAPDGSVRRSTTHRTAPA